MKRARKGFTLVEMLVVIGLVAILLSMMVGGLSVVQNIAWQTRSFVYPWLIHWFVVSFTLLLTTGAV